MSTTAPDSPAAQSAPGQSAAGQSAPDSPAAPYSRRVIASLLDFLHGIHPEVNTDKLLAEIGLSPRDVSGDALEDGWLTQDQLDAFFRAASETSGDAYLAHRAGRYFDTARRGNRARSFVMSAFDPVMAFRGISVALPNHTSAVTMETHSLSGTSADVVISPAPGIDLRQYQCDYFSGLIEGITYSLDCTPSVEHPQCAVRGEGACRYVVTWQSSQRRQNFRKAMVAGVTAGLVVGAFGLGRKAFRG